MVEIPFFKKIQFPKFNFRFPLGAASFVGIDIGSDSVKVVQLRKERERAILETYGELKARRYFEKPVGGGIAAFLQASDQSIAELLGDVIRESNVTAKHLIFSIPAASSFVTEVRFPLIGRDEIEAAVPFEAKKYIPIPLSEVALDWQITEEDETAKRVAVLLAAVPKEVVAKYQRVADLLKLELKAVEIEAFSLVRSLLPGDRGVTALIHWGSLVTTLTVADARRIRLVHNVGHGSREATLALTQSLGVAFERAEEMKRQVGLSEKPEEREIAGVIRPTIDAILADFERTMLAYNRTSKRKIQRIIISGGGASLGGLVDHVARRYGLETALGNSFGRTVFPAFLQPVLREIAPNFAVATGLALREIAL